MRRSALAGTHGERATENTAHRVRLMTTGVPTVKSKEAQIFQVPIPEGLRSPSYQYHGAHSFFFHN